MRVTQNASRRALQRVATNQAVEGRLRGVWARRGLAPDLIDILMAPVRRVHAEAEDDVHVYGRKS